MPSLEISVYITLSKNFLSIRLTYSIGSISNNLVHPFTAILLFFISNPKANFLLKKLFKLLIKSGFLNTKVPKTILETPDSIQNLISSIDLMPPPNWI